MFLTLLLFLQVSDADQRQADRVLDMARQRGAQEAVVLLETAQQEPYAFGLDLAQRLARPKDAAQWFRALLRVEPKNAAYRFGLAWTLWMDQDTQGALKMVSGLLTHKDILARARANYLTGLIHARLLKPDLAETHFLKSIENYRALKMHGGIYATAMELANLNTAKGKYKEAFDWFDQAERANNLLVSELKQKPMHWGKAMIVRYNLAFDQGDYPTAIRFAERAIAPYEEEGNLTMVGLSRTRIGLCQAYLGQLDLAEETARAVDDYAATHNLEVLRIHNLLIWIYLTRRRDLDPSPFIQDIEAWCKAHNDNWLHQVMRNVLKDASKKPKPD